MWTQDIDPLGDIALSASTALVLIVVFLVCLVGLRLSGILASVIALAAQLPSATVRTLHADGSSAHTRL